MTRRSAVNPASTYRKPNTRRDRLCALCGGLIDPDDPWSEQSDPAWGDVPLPVHDSCEDPDD